MDDKEKIATLVEQARWMTQDIHEIKSDVKLLLAFRWKLYGTNAAISSLFGGAVAIVIELLRSRA